MFFFFCFRVAQRLFNFFRRKRGVKKQTQQHTNQMSAPVFILVTGPRHYSCSGRKCLSKYWAVELLGAFVASTMTKKRLT